MSVGRAVRDLMGPAFPLAGRVYRRVFVDVRKVADHVPELGQDALLLDVGTGDGEILNHVLDRQPTVRVVALDTITDVGGWLRPDLAHRVSLRPGTLVADYVRDDGPPVDAALLSDVVHHVPQESRPQLFRDVLAAFGDHPPVVIVKDIIPFGARSAFAFWADRNITGDKGVRAVGPAELVDIVRSVWPEARVRSTGLERVDNPNYCLVFTDRAGAHVA